MSKHDDVHDLIADRVTRRIMAELESVGLVPPGTTAGQGTPTPVEPTPPSAGKDTPMERSTDKDEEDHPTSVSKKISALRGAGLPEFRREVLRKIDEIKRRSCVSGYAEEQTWTEWTDEDRLSLGGPDGYSDTDLVDVQYRDGTISRNIEVGRCRWGRDLAVPRKEIVGYRFPAEDHTPTASKKNPRFCPGLTTPENFYRGIGMLGARHVVSVPPKKNSGTVSLLELAASMGAEHWGLSEWEGFLREHGPKMPGSFSEFISGSSAPEKISDLGSDWIPWDGRLKQRWPSGLEADDIVDVRRRDGQVLAGKAAVSLRWEHAPASPSRNPDFDVVAWRRHVPADADNGPDGAFGPDVVEVDVDLGRDIRVAMWDEFSQLYLRTGLMDEVVRAAERALKRNGL